MKLSEFEKLPDYEQTLIKIAATIAREGKDDYDMYIHQIAMVINKSNLSKTLMPEGDAKILAKNIAQKLHKDKNLNLAKDLNVIKSVEVDAIIQKLKPFTKTVTPSNVNEKDFHHFKRLVDEINSDYISQSYQEVEKKGLNIYHIWKMVHTSELSDFFDRLFTKEESPTCSHDKTVHVIKSLKKAILEDKNIELISYFGPDEDPQLAGKKTYWSTDLFKDTDDVIEYLTKTFYL